MIKPYAKILKKNWEIITITTFLTVLSSLFMVFAGFSLSFFFTAYEQQGDKIKALGLTFLIELMIWLTAMGMYHLSLIAKCTAKKLIRHDIRVYVSNKINSMSYLDQQVYLFQDTLRYNITLGQVYSDAEIERILQKCCLTELAASLPQGIDTIITENGKNLSGGQRQRIALARSLIRSVKWIILDESTSALDKETAAQIESNLLKQDDLGVIFITHHLREETKSQLSDLYTIGT